MGRIYYNSNGIILENSKILFDVDQTTTTTTSTTRTTRPPFTIYESGGVVYAPCAGKWYIQLSHGYFNWDGTTSTSHVVEGTGMYCSTTETACESTYGTVQSNTLYF